jgi:hypothetical protein
LIYICIPAHNEEQTVGVVLWKIRQVMAEFPRDYQILVADDASTDKTSEVLSPYARVLPLTVVRTETRRGYSASLEMLLREAVRRSEYPKRDVIVTIQADFSQEPEDIVPIIKAMEAGADIVCGESTLPPETAWRIRWSRSMAGRILKRKSVPAGVKDPFTGFRAYRVFTIKKAMEERAGGRLLLHDSWAANAELLAVTTPHARRIDPIDVTVRPHRLQRASRLQPWPALKNVWAYARKAKPEVEAASVSELDESVASGAVSRRNDVASVRERMSERSDMHGNRSPHGDRLAHNARPEPRRGERSRDRNNTRGRDNARDGGRSNTSSERPRSESPRNERPARNERPKAERTQGEAQENQQRGDRQRNPRGERKPKEPRQPRARPDAAAAAPASASSAEAADLEALKAGGSDVDNPAESAATEPTKRRRRRGRRSRGGANRNANNGVEGDVIASDSAADVPVSSSDSPDDENVGASVEDSAGDGAPGADGTPAKKRRRGRRGGRGRRRQNATADGSSEGAESSEGAQSSEGAPYSEGAHPSEGAPSVRAEHSGSPSQSGDAAHSGGGAVSTNGDNHPARAGHQPPEAHVPAPQPSHASELNDVA